MRLRIFLLATVIFFSGAFFYETKPFAKEKDPILYRGREYRDPTVNPLLSKPVVQEEQEKVREFVTLPSLTIQGIVWGGNFPRAIIDRQVVTKGDVLPEGIEILDISEKGIKMLYRGKIFNVLSKGVVEEK